MTLAISCKLKLSGIDTPSIGARIWDHTFIQYYLFTCNLFLFYQYIGKGETNNMKGTYLGEFEELVLLTVGILFGDAYGLAVADELEKQTGRTVMMSSVHKALVRLEEKGYLKSHLGGSTETRGGRDKRLYRLTHAGTKVLNQSKELRNAMYKQVPKVVWTS